MTRIELGDLTVRDIGRTVTITHQGTTITGQLVDFRVETAWILEERIDQHPDDVVQTPGRRSIDITVGPWHTERLPLSTGVEVER